MVRRSTRWSAPVSDGGAAARLRRAFETAREELEVPREFPPEVLAAAEEAARGGPRSGDAGAHGEREDMRDLPFWTVDPPGSQDLDQALHLERRPGGGHRVRYAIADVGAFVAPGSPLDAEARRRGQTLYAPDVRVPLHPPVLSEGAASLLPGQDRPAVVWTLDLDEAGEVVAVDLRRALVRSRERREYTEVQAAADAGDDERAVVLREVGERRLRLEAERGGASLPLPEVEVVAEDGGFDLRVRPPLAAEDWNAQVSLMTGAAAADLMLVAQVGVLRTLPPPEPALLARFHRQVRALRRRPWPAEQPYGVLLRDLDPAVPGDLALLHEAAALFRGADYTAMDGALPEVVEHAAVAEPYAHTTAPLRRLVDRFVQEVCLAVASDRPVPDELRAALPELPALMRASDRRAGALDRACTDAVEAALLTGRRDELDGVVVDVDDDPSSGKVQVLDPPVLARCSASASRPLELGAAVRVRVAEADVEARRVILALA